MVDNVDFLNRGTQIQILMEANDYKVKLIKINGNT